MQKINLPDGAWATLRDPKKVSEGRRRPVTALATRLNASGVRTALKTADDSALTEEHVQIMSEMNDAVVVALVADWSFLTPAGEPLPVTLDNLLGDDVPGDAYNALRFETSKYFLDLLPDFGPTVDPESPTSPSAP